MGQAETSVNGMNGAGEGGKLAFGKLEVSRVHVEQHDRAGRIQVLCQQEGMAATPSGAVDDDVIWSWGKQVHGFLWKDWGMRLISHCA